MTGPFDPLVKLVQNVFHLREDIFQNARDHELESGEGVAFSFLVDTAVVRLYAEPREWAARLSALPSLYGVDVEQEKAPDVVLGSPSFDMSSRSVLEANALLTGEFMFSEALVGRGNRMLVAPEHVQEVMNYISGIELRLGPATVRNAVDSDPYSKVRHDLGAILQLTEAGRMLPEQALERTRQLLVAGLAEMSHSDLLAPHRLNRLFDRDLLGRAVGQDRFTADVISPPAVEVRWWMQAIRDAKRDHSVLPRPRALEADAVTLAQLARLNRDWRDQRHAYLLITDDRGLYSAYLRWLRVERQAGRQHFFPLRSSRQYIPILNINAMGGEFRETGVFQQITAAVSYFTDPFLSNDTPDLAWFDEDYRTPPGWFIRQALVEQLRRLGGNAGPWIDDVNEQIRNIESLWTSALTYAATAKSDTIKELVTSDLMFLRRMLSGATLKNAFATEVDRLKRGFQGLGDASILLRNEIRALEATGESGVDAAVDLHGRRDVASSFSEFSSPRFQGRGVAEIAHELLELGPGARDILEDVETDERLFVMGVVCLDIGAWAAADTLLSEAEAACARPRDGRHPALEGEVRFLRCVARRLAADRRNWASEHGEVGQALRRLIAAAAPSSLEAVRAHGERFALHLCAVAWLWSPSRAELAHSEVRRCLGLFQECLAAFSRSPVMDAEPAECWRHVRQQFDLNTMVLAFWWHILAGEMDLDLRKAAEAAVANSSSAVKGGDHGEIYPRLAKYALDPEGRSLVSAELVSGIDAILTRDRQSGFAFDIPHVDREEYSKVRYLMITRVDPPSEQAPA